MTPQDANLLIQTDRGTRCGELLRRYWQPVALSEELPHSSAPRPITVMGEDLVLFRDSEGRPGLLGLHCSHRGADLSYGRVEDGGLRCIYHGWLYDLRGRCLEQPGEAGGGEARDAIRHPAYPCAERAGVIFAYLGPGEPPLFPEYEFLEAPEDQVSVTKFFQDCNYLQGHEASMDLLHVSFLHLTDRDRQPAVLRGTPGQLSGRGNAAGHETIEAELTDFGLRVCKIRKLNEGQNYVRVASLVLPNLTVVPGRLDGLGGYAVNWHVPIDDRHHWKFFFTFARDRALDPTFRVQNPEIVTSDYRPVRNKANRYLQDRASMKTQSYSGLGHVFQDHDTCVAEGMGPIQDRTREHLMPSDIAIVMGRKLLLNALNDIAEGRDPLNVARQPAAKHFSGIVSTSAILPVATDWKEHCRKVLEQLVPRR